MLPEALIKAILLSGKGGSGVGVGGEGEGRWRSRVWRPMGGGEMIMDQDVSLWGTKRLASCKKEHSGEVNAEGVDQCTMERIN